MATDLLTPTDAAGRIGVHPRTLKRWALEGKVRHIRLPSGRFLFPEDVIAEVLTERIPEETP